MGLGQAGVFAGHVSIIVSAMMILWRFVPMARAVEHGLDDQTTIDALKLLPLTITLFAIVATAEALFYGAARVLVDYGVDLWKSYEAVWLLRASVAVTLIMHMPAYWRYRGYGRRGARRKTTIDGLMILAVWVAALLIFW